MRSQRLLVVPSLALAARSAVLLACTSSILAGCSSHREDTASADQNYEIWPEADENLGYIQVDLPAAPSGQPIDPFVLVFDHNMVGSPPGIPSELTLTPGVPQRARKGRGTLYIKRPGDRGDIDTPVQIAAGQTAHLTLGLVQLQYWPTLIEPGGIARRGTPADFGPTPWVYPPLVYLMSWTTAFDARALTAAFNGAAGSWAAFLPDQRYTFEVADGTLWGTNLQGVVDTKTVYVSAGGAQSVTLSRPVPTSGQPGQVRFVMPQRALPNPPSYGVCPGNPAEDVLIINAKYGRINDDRVVGLYQYDDPTAFCYGQSQASRPDLPNFVQVAKRVSDGTLTIYPQSQGSSAQYELVLNPLFSMDVLPVAGQTIELRPQRIDVHDIAVTREDGSSFVSRGVYRVYRAQQDGTYAPVGPNGAALNFDTNTGIDVPPGKYRIEVECVAADCTNRLQTHDLDLN